MLRIDVKLGKAQQALSEIEYRLEYIRTWWWPFYEHGEITTAAPDTEILTRGFLSGLDIAERANLVLENWQNCLTLLSEIETVEKCRGKDEHTLAI
jgi:hypothetical protein